MAPVAQSIDSCGRCPNEGRRIDLHMQAGNKGSAAHDSLSLNPLKRVRYPLKNFIKSCPQSLLQYGNGSTSPLHEGFMRADTLGAAAEQQYLTLIIIFSSRCNQANQGLSDAEFYSLEVQSSRYQSLVVKIQWELKKTLEKTGRTALDWGQFFLINRIFEGEKGCFRSCPTRCSAALAARWAVPV